MDDRFAAKPRRWARFTLAALLFAASSLHACKRSDDTRDDAPPKRKLATRSTEVTSVDLPIEENPNRFLDRRGRFQITFPDGWELPKPATSPVVTDVGTLTIYSFQAMHGEESYAALYLDYPSIVVGTKGQKQVLADVEAGVLAQVHGTMTSHRAGTRNGKPYRAFTFNFDQPVSGTPAVGRFLALLDGDRLYQVGYEGPGPVASLDDFFDSFTLVP